MIRAGRTAAVVLVITAAARPEVTVAQGGSSAERATDQRPGEFPNHLFQSPFPAPAVENEEFREKYLFGDWLGARSKLAAHGIKPTVLLIADPFGNAAGGRRRGFTDYNLLALDLLVDTDKLVLWGGGQFHVGFAANFGTSLSTNYIGNNFPVQLADVASANPRLTYLSYTQSLSDDRVSIRVGRVTINSVYGEEFLASPYFKAFTSVGIDLVPLGIFLNAPGAFGYPETTWGARVKFEPLNRFYAMAGIYNGDPAVKEGARNGVDFSFHGPPFVISEVGLRWHYDKQASGLPGNAKAGAYTNRRSGFYVLSDQVLSRWGDSEENRHLGVFGALTVAPDERINRVPYFFDTGLMAYGLLSGRPKDHVGFGVVYGSYSRDLRRAEGAAEPFVGVQDFELTVEWTYGCTVRPGVLVQPDVQYIVAPAGNKSIPNALAIGLNLSVNF